MHIDLFSIFPADLEAFLDMGVVGRARGSGLVEIRVHDLRTGAQDARGSVDDAPFGGGAGMVLMAPPVFAAVEAVEGLARPLLLLAPGGRRFTQTIASELARQPGFSLLCGRYEGVDQRIADHLVDGELSIGDFVLPGGESAAACVVEAVTRLVPGVLGNDESSADESFADGLLEYPQYTRPAEFRGWVVPPVLRSGDHGAVARWRRTQALVRTVGRRPDLLDSPLSAEDQGLLDEARDAADPGVSGKGTDRRG